MPDSLQPHRLQHARFPCPPLSPRVCSNSSPLSQWCYITISSSATLFSFCLQSFQALGDFSLSCLFTSSGQIIGASDSVSVLPMNIPDWLPLGLTGLISVESKGLSKISNTTIQKYNFFSTQPSLWSNSHNQTWLGKNHSFDYMDFVGKVMSLLFNTLSRLAIAFLPRSKRLLISWQQSLSALTLEPKKIKSVTASTFSPSTCQEVLGIDAMIFLQGVLNCVLLILHLLKGCNQYWVRELGLILS